MTYRVLRFAYAAVSASQLHSEDLTDLAVVVSTVRHTC